MTTQTAPTVPATDLDRLAVDTVRVLAMDTIQKAGSGHPGTAMALGPAAYVLWTGSSSSTRPTHSGRPGPVRAVQRARLGAAVCGAAPDRLPAGHRDSSSSASGLAHPRHPEYGQRPGGGHTGRWGRAGRRGRVRHRRAAAAPATTGRARAATTAPGVLRRRGHDEGVASEASSLAGTCAGQADGGVRRQPHHHRRAHLHHLHRDVASV